MATWLTFLRDLPCFIYLLLPDNHRPAAALAPLPTILIDIRQTTQKRPTQPHSYLLRFPTELRQHIFSFLLADRIVELSLSRDKTYTRYVVLAAWHPASLAVPANTGKYLGRRLP
jgi:hypothetical protein